MSSWGLGDMFEVDSADTSEGTFPLMWMRGQVEGLQHKQSERARTRIYMSGDLL
jgi:hypothetical protein